MICAKKKTKKKHKVLWEVQKCKRSSLREQLLTSNHFLINFPPLRKITSHTQNTLIHFELAVKISFSVRFLFLTECFLFFKEDLFSVQND